MTTVESTLAKSMIVILDAFANANLSAPEDTHKLLDARVELSELLGKKEVIHMPVVKKSE